MDLTSLERRFRMAPGTTCRLADHPTDLAESGLDRAGLAELKLEAKEVLEAQVRTLARAQELLWASDRRSVLVVLQGMDTAGKDGLIRSMLTGVNPQGCDVVSFKQPSDEELDHTFLWRCMKRTPERGRIAIFNRSHYEDVLVARVRPEVVEAARLPDGPRDEDFWNARYEDIVAFERHLARNGTLVLKFFLHLSKAEQRTRLLARLDDPAKHWKFSSGDLAERSRWDAYRDAYERAITATSTVEAPWFVVPADRKWVTRTLVAAIVAGSIEALGLEVPASDPGRAAELAEARRRLEAELESVGEDSEGSSSGGAPSGEGR